MSKATSAKKLADKKYSDAVGKYSKYLPTSDQLSDVYKSGSHYAADYRDRAAGYGDNILSYVKETYPVVFDKAKSLAQTAAENSKSALHVAGSQLGNAASTVGEGVRCTERRLLKASFVFLVYKWFSKDEPIQKAAEKVKAHINENPVKSTVIALGAGYFLAKALRK